MSMAQLLGVWNSMPRTEAANLATANQTAVAQTYAAMDKAVNQTSTSTTSTKSNSNIFGDILPAVGGMVGGIFGGPAGAMIGSTLGGVGGSLMGGNQAASLGGMGASFAGSLGGMMETESPWSWKAGTKKSPLSGGPGWSLSGSGNFQGSGMSR